MSSRQNNVTVSFLFRVFGKISEKNPNMQLPLEIQTNIIAEVINQRTGKMKRKVAMLPSLSPAFTPPANGACPFMAAPPELRRRFFAESLPDRDAIHHPNCEDDDSRGLLRNNFHGIIKPRRNRVSDLMTLNRKISSEITELLYEERFFVIHVHEGLREGGIEFLDAGRQPLQYKDSIEDARFHKFGKDDEFGFHRLKKIIVQIYPTTENSPRHMALNTYFMNLALCRLLQRSGEEKHRITSIKIQFPDSHSKSERSAAAIGRAAIQRAEQYWWDADKQHPRATSITNVSNIELVLRPFGNLTSCYSVQIELPENVRNHQPTVDFVSELKASMESRHGTLSTNDRLEMNIETARYALEEFVTYTVHGKGYHHVPKLTETEMREDLVDFDSAIDLTDDGSNITKHSLSTNHLDRGSDGKHKPGQSCGGWAGEQRLTIESYGSMQEEEDRQIAAAISASLDDISGIQYPRERPQIQPDMSPARFHLQGPANGYNHEMRTNPFTYSPVLTSGRSPFRGPRCTLTSSEDLRSVQFSQVPGVNGRGRSWGYPQGMQYRPPRFGNGQIPVSKSHIAEASAWVPFVSNDLSISANNEAPASSYGLSSGSAPKENYTKSTGSYHRGTSKLNPLANGFTPTAGGPNTRISAFPRASNPALVRSLRLRRIEAETIDLTGDSDSEDDTQGFPLSALSSTLSSPLQNRLRLESRGTMEKTNRDMKEETGDGDQH